MWVNVHVCVHVCQCTCVCVCMCVHGEVETVEKSCESMNTHTPACVAYGECQLTVVARLIGYSVTNVNI